jgi:hypothetical protein
MPHMATEKRERKGTMTTKSTAKPKAKGAPRPAKPKAADAPASRLIDQRIRDLADWRGQALARMRKLIKEAVPDVVEEWKWKGTPVWSHDGILCTGESYKDVVKLTFATGASLKDPSRLFNSSLEGNTRRAIDIREGQTVDAAAFKALVKAAVAHNAAKAGAKPKPGSTKPTKAAAAAGAAPAVKLLSGGNPQIAKADGDAPVQAYIAAMPGWKSGLGRRLDAIISANVPNVLKAVRWNSPFYGVEGRGWFVSYHTFTRYVKVTFFAGTSLRPIPPGGTPKSKEVRWIDIHEDDGLDAAQMTAWVTQAAALPGWIP